MAERAVPTDRPASAGWAAPAPTLEVLAARRTALITRIAELTDRAERDQAAVVVAQQRRSRTGSRLADARQAIRDRARKAYMHGLGQTAEALARPNVYLEVSFRRDRRAVEALRAARAADDGATRPSPPVESHDGGGEEADALTSAQ
jgi:hypothetical protein